MDIYFCSPKTLWPPDICAILLFYLVVFLFLIITNSTSILFWKEVLPGQQILRSGYLKPIFYLVLFGHLINSLFLPLIALFCLRHWLSFQLLLLFILNSIFWSIASFRLWINRFKYDLPILLNFSYAIFALISLLPFVFWRICFPNGIYESYFLIYVIGVSNIFFIFFSCITGRALKREEESAWANGISWIVDIWPYIWPRKSVHLQLTVLACLFILAIGRAINVLIPLYSKWIVDVLSAPEPYFCWQLILIASIFKFLQGSGAQGGLLNTIRSFLWLQIQQYTTLEIEVALLRHLHSLSLSWHLSRRTGEVLRIMEKGVDSMNTLLNYVLFNVLPSLLDIILASIFFFTNFNIYFGFLVLFTMIIYLISTVIISEWRISHRRAMNESDKRAGAIGVDSLINYETIKHYNAEELETQRYKAAYQIYQKAEYKANASLSALNFCQNSIIGFGLISGCLLAAYFIVSHNIEGKMLSAGDYVLFTTYLLQLYGPLNFFGTIYRTIQRSFIDMENMRELLKQDIEIKDAIGAKELEAFPGRIEFCDVSFAYKTGHPVLQNLSFIVDPGQTIALVGPSGSGKTTIVRLLFRLYDVTDGQILFNGTDIRMLKMHSLRSRIGIVPQDTVLFNDTIRYNIRYGRPTATNEEIEGAAKAAAIHNFITSHPDGYECLVGERGLKLSGGEKQRVAIARAVLKRPEYILLDEATSALDSKTERSIQQNLFELCNRRTCVIVAHRLSTVIHADKILVLKEGKIIESGTHEQLLENKGLYSEMWLLQNEKGSGIDLKINNEEEEINGK
ncbi:hypothetical protein ACQ4LE_009072 [Meloidogyne hapla]|uniref:ATP-binding cassette sub-family B member 6, mitochondrial n=1 Tax=Meloidogyne hapla TaxID=6305 RepID=A0A1I8BG39_MELHA